MTTPGEFLGSSETFIRSLKSPHDPPISPGPSKVEIALQGWSASEFYVPGKAELLTEWALTRLLKDNASQSTILDDRYWHLLASILARDKFRTRSEPWLPPVLSRIPTLPIFTSYFRWLATSKIVMGSLHSNVTVVFEAVAPFSVPKANTEVVLECFAALLRSLLPSSEVDSTSVESLMDVDYDSLSTLLSSVLPSIRKAFETATNKKRLLVAFIDSCSLDWVSALKAIPQVSDGAHCTLWDTVHEMGEHVLFNGDTLRSWVDDPKTWQDLIVKLGHHTNRAAVLEILPRLLRSFATAVHRHSGVLPSSSTATSPLSSARTFSLPPIQLVVDFLQKQSNTDIWRCREEILTVISGERLYDAGSSDWRSMVDSLVQESLVYLQSPSRGKQEVTSRINALSIIELALRADSSIVEHYLARLLSCCVDMGHDINSVFEKVLERILDYHSKARSLNSFIITLGTVLDETTVDAPVTEARHTYDLYTSGPLFAICWEKALITAVSNFLTPGQLLPTYHHLNELLLQLKGAGSVSASEDSSRPHKRRKIAPDSQKELSLYQTSVRFTLLSRYVACLYGAVLRRDPGDPVIEGVVACLQELYDGLLEVTREATPTSLASAASLWNSSKLEGVLRLLRVGFVITVGSPIFPATAKEAIWACTFRIVTSLDIGDELWMGSFRLAMDIVRRYRQRDSSSSSPVMDAFLQRIAASQLGEMAPHAAGPGDMGALTRLILTEGLTFVDEFGTASQIRRAADLILDAFIHDTTLSQALSCSSIFWESHRIRGELLHSVQERSKILQSLTIPTVLRTQESFPPTMALDSMRNAAMVLKPLFAVPPECVGPSDRDWILNTLIVADTAVNGTRSSSAYPTDLRIGLRTLAAAILPENSQVSLDFTNLIRYVLLQTNSETVSEALVEATLQLVGAIQEQIVRASRRMPDDLLQILAVYSTLPPCSPDQPETTLAAPPLKLLCGAVSNLLELVSTVYSSVDDVPEEFLIEINTLSERIASTVPAILQKFGTSKSLDECHQLAKAWSTALATQRWAGSQVDGLTAMHAGAVALARTLTSPTSSNMSDSPAAVRSSLFAVILHGWQFSRDQDRAVEFDIICDVYLSLTEKDTTTNTPVDTLYSSACRSLQLGERQRAVERLRRLWHLTTKDGEEPIRELRALTYLLTQIPSGQNTHALTESILSHLAHEVNSGCSAHLLSQALECLTRLSTDAPSSLSSVGMGHVWSILGAACRPAETHTPAPYIFSEIVVLVGSLLRSHRFLLVDSLPLLAHVLVVLLLALRTSRSSLGQRQTLIVTSSHPAWIAAEAPLRIEHAAQLSRLMETLVIKTSARSHQRGSQPKLESLARSFARHAPCVLRTYIDMITDPLAYVSPEIRRELQPGTYALCSMVTQEDRDSLMASLGRGTSKALFRALWQQYDKQKYIGKG